MFSYSTRPWIKAGRENHLMRQGRALGPELGVGNTSHQRAGVSVRVNKTGICSCSATSMCTPARIYRIYRTYRIPQGTACIPHILIYRNRIPHIPHTANRMGAAYTVPAPLRGCTIKGMCMWGVPDVHVGGPLLTPVMCVCRMCVCVCVTTPTYLYR